jgi:hypothetical protein
MVTVVEKKSKEQISAEAEAFADAVVAHGFNVLKRKERDAQFERGELVAVSKQKKNQFLIGAVAAAVVAALLGFVIGQSAGLSAGKAEGYAEGFGVGSRDGWERAVTATTQEAYWLGAFDACAMVFEAAGWEYIYVNPSAGGGTISKEFFCRDNGDYSGTPVLDIPYVDSNEESN